MRGTKIVQQNGPGALRRRLQTTISNSELTLLTILLLSVAMLLLPLRLVGAESPGTKLPPDEVIKQTTDRFLEAVRNEGDTISEDPDRVLELVNEIVLPHLDVNRFARGILGKHWRRATTEQQDQFIDEFRTLMVRRYASMISDYTDVDIVYFPARKRKETRAIVPTEFPQPTGPAVEVDYRLSQTEGQWKVYDVVIEGVSMLATYRSTFSSEVNRIGLDGVIEELSAKNRQVGKS